MYHVCEAYIYLYIYILISFIFVKRFCSRQDDLFLYFIKAQRFVDIVSAHK